MSPNPTLSRRLQQGLVRLAPYGGAALLLAGLVHSGISESLDRLLYDWTLSSRPLASARGLPIAIVGIDADDVQRYGWPIDDGLICHAIDQAAAAGATAIGLDLYRDKGVGPHQACLRRLARQQPRLVTIFGGDGAKPVPGSPVEQRSYNDLIVDADGVVRRDLVHVSGQDAATVAFPMRLVEVATGNRSLRRQLDDPRQAEDLGPWLPLAGRAGGYRHLDQEMGGGYQRLLPLRQPNSFTTLSLHGLLSNPSTANRNALQGRIVLIGSTDPTLKDLLPTPLTEFRSERRGEQMRTPGVEIHALRVAGLLNDQAGRPWPLRTAPPWMDNSLELLALLLGAWLGEAFRKLRASVLATALATLALAAAGGGALWWFGLWLGVALPVIGLPVMAAVGWLRRGAVSQLQQQQVQRLLGQTTSPAVAQQLWEQRDELLRDGRFEGRQLPVTILFSDTCSFTSVSEHFEPADLLAWLNRGMARIVPAVTRRGGMVNKFTGDGMLAVFGAPISKGESQDARDAIEAALEIQAELDALNRELAADGAPAMRMRVGVHSGEVLAGSMGSSERLEYAVIGDAVNCASRLESLEKQRHDLNCRVLVSSTTRALYDADDLQWLEWGPLQVKGRSEPLQVSELRGSSDPARFSWGSAPATGPATRR